MDDETAFIELSALLTGLYDQLVNDQEDRALNGPIAREYARRLLGTFPELLNAYKSLAEADPKPPIDDNLLADLRKTEAFKNNEFVAKQIVNIWYFSQFTAVENDPHAPHLDGGFFERGHVWVGHQGAPDRVFRSAARLLDAGAETCSLDLNQEGLMSNHYDDHYDVIIVGSGVAGAIDRQGQGGS